MPVVNPRAIALRLVDAIERHATWIALAMSLLVVYALYGRALGFSFLFDDTFDLTRVEGRSYWQLLSSSEGYSYYRPIPFLIWKALRDTQGHYDQATLHALPLIAHAIAGWCLFLLLRRLGAGLWAAFPALLFLTFPFHYQNIAVVGTLFHPLTGAAMLGSLVLYERARGLDAGERQAARGIARFRGVLQTIVQGTKRRISVILRRSEGSPGLEPGEARQEAEPSSSNLATPITKGERSFAAAQDDRGSDRVLAHSGSSDSDSDRSARHTGAIWHIAALMATLIALWAHESGVVIAGLLVLLEVVVLWRTGARRPSPWLARHLLAALLFIITWFTVEKAPFTDRTSLDEIQPKSLFYLQGFTWPLSAQTYWIQDNLGIPGGVTVATVGLLDVGLVALIGVFAAYTLSAWRVRCWELLAIPAFGLAIGVAASAPSLWRLSWAYVENSPRLLYLLAIGAAIFWGLLPALRFGNARLTWAWRAITMTLLLLVVVQSWRFVDVRMAMWERGSEIVDDITASGETYDGQQILVMNAPSWFAQGVYEYPYGHFGVQLMPEYIGLDRVIYTSSERSAEVAAASGTWSPDTEGGRYGFGPHGPEMPPEQIDALLREGHELIVVRPAGGRYSVRDVGRIEPGSADPELEFAGQIDDFVRVDTARVAAIDGKITVYVDWHVLNAFPVNLRTQARVAIVEVRDSSGAAVFTYAGDALAGFSPLMFWQFGDLIADSIAFPLPEDGAYSVHVGVQRVFASAPMPAASADGTEYADGMLPIGAFVVSDGVVTSAGSAP